MNQELNLVGTIRIFIKWWKHIAAMIVGASPCRSICIGVCDG
jgi:hypothetical protein